MSSAEELLSPDPAFIGLVAQTPRDNAPSLQTPGSSARWSTHRRYMTRSDLCSLVFCQARGMIPVEVSERAIGVLCRCLSPAEPGAGLGPDERVSETILVEGHASRIRSSRARGHAGECAEGGMRRSPADECCHPTSGPRSSLPGSTQPPPFYFHSFHLPPAPQRRLSLSAMPVVTTFLIGTAVVSVGQWLIWDGRPSVSSPSPRPARERASLGRRAAPLFGPLYLCSHLCLSCGLPTRTLLDLIRRTRLWRTC